MILSVDTVKDAPADLRAAAALILSIAESRDGSASQAQKHPFPPLHQAHHEHMPAGGEPVAEDASRPGIDSFMRIPAATVIGTNEVETFPAVSFREKPSVPESIAPEQLIMASPARIPTSYIASAAPASATASSLSPQRPRRIAELLAEIAQENPDDRQKHTPVTPEPEQKPLVRRIPPGVQVY